MKQRWAKVVAGSPLTLATRKLVEWVESAPDCTAAVPYEELDGTQRLPAATPVLVTVGPGCTERRYLRLDLLLNSDFGTWPLRGDPDRCTTASNPLDLFDIELPGATLEGTCQAVQILCGAADGLLDELLGCCTIAERNDVAEWLQALPVDGTYDLTQVSRRHPSPRAILHELFEDGTSWEREVLRQFARDAEHWEQQQPAIQLPERSAAAA